MSNFNSYINPVIKEIQAQQTFDPSGQMIAKTESKSRLKMGDDPRFYVAAQVIGQTSSWLTKARAYLGKKLGFYVEVKSEKDSTVLLNVNSIMTRLHLTKGQIQEAAENKTLMTLLETQAKEVVPLLSKYQEFMKQYDISKKGEWIAQRGNKKKIQTGLTSATVMKALTIALKTNFNNLSLTNYEFKVDGKHFVMGLGKKGQLKLDYISKLLGKGSFGEAFLVIDVNKGKEKVLKQAQHTVGKVARRDLQNEFEKLNAIHAKGKVWGIQAKPSQIMEIVPKGFSANRRYGYLGKKYEGDYEKDIKKNRSASLKERLFEFHQLLGGLDYLTKNNLLHGDLKPENVFVKKKSDGTKLVHIADLGSVRDTSTLTIREILEKGSYTAAYCPAEDLKAALNCFYISDKIGLIEVEQKRDVYAMGAIFYQALTGQQPYKLDSKEHPILSKYKDITDPSVPEEFRNLIKKMLDPDYRNRPTASEVFTTLKNYIQIHEPHLQAEIHKAMSPFVGSS